ncbi:tRNA 2-thiocytidine biosynthesis protein TtcA [Bacillus sp. HMF5848]|uniref:tRNA lysidine(34) synthetase n=1 Tax=Bacillus sp. HMF5848 TaxID=2495421 RepID=UPI000F7908F1|nr:tRNA 2-thiocytidine biosynthesis TtcA family protein [Bacillus sp. HMF5848]RSK26997.1 tRNA 2-thiocytidine biosynthesis protein TtcA [Bacillus sp. HMF5848]
MERLSNNETQRLLKPMKQIIRDYELISDGDRIAVGLSGGKDSSTLLYLLTKLQWFGPTTFEIVPISLSLGFKNMEIEPLIQFVERLGHSLHIVPTDISKVVFDYRQEKNPCSLCAKLRHGILYEEANALNCNKVAYGHHLDDAIETFFLNFLYQGRFGTFKPLSYLDRTQLAIIRPLITIEEKHIQQFVIAKKIPIIYNPCPADKQTKREEIKQLINQLAQNYPDIRHKFINAVSEVDMDKFWLNK